ncbi:Pathogenesis-related homeodomain protein [Actinidia chinensis var. chinensis]|uniref:Pathogenesis-related homeodomain protein n=1 Tax=Actinidia chinensis var. chinensis TaxID=1590841 RepID=A0A2R6Q384_ACTCC|nr:Pathogenesis-related homeodomain protein [Actinidia chinensis var. chinensis]
MQGSGRKLTKQETENPSLTKTGTVSKLNAAIHIINGTKRSHMKRHRQKLKSHGKTVGPTVLKKKIIKSVSKGMRNGSSSGPVTLEKILHNTKLYKKQHSLSLQGEKPSFTSCKEIGKEADGDVKSQKVKTRRKRRKRRDNTELDEPSRLQRRTRYLLIKMKLEQNLIDAYSGEGWKGQSREKIKPEKELQRAKKQILKCKLGIRDAIRQLHFLSSVGHIEDSAIAPDGSVHHEHIICAKCKLQEAFPDNDIILCDGTCNCAFHQKCLDPPLLTENIPPGDQGWFCKFCECKMEILESVNAHLGTRFSEDSRWEDIFKDEASLPGGGALLDQEQEWPSDDSEDADYDPEKNENSCSYSRPGSEADASDDASSSSNLWSLEDEVFTESGRPSKRSKGEWNTSFESYIDVDSDKTTDNEILNGPRQRSAVDYKKLYAEMFGKDALASDQISEDEDWGPAKRKRRGKESDAASTLMTLCESEKKFPSENTTERKEMLPPSETTKQSLFRIPHIAVERLRLVFAENELPSRAVRENLSKQLGLDFEKVNKWFKNARYIALKSRKEDEAKQLLSPKFTKESRKNGKDEAADSLASKDISSATPVHSSKHLKSVNMRKNWHSLSSPSKKRKHKGSLLNRNKIDMDFGDDVSLKLLKDFAKKKKRVNFKAGTGVEEAEAELERLCKVKRKVEKLQQVLLGLPNRKSHKTDASVINEHSVIYVPVAELRDKI